MFGYFKFVVFLNLIMCLSCAGYSQPTYSAYQDHAGDSIIQGVPFIKQRYNYCGPAAIASVMKYYGDYKDQEEIAGYVYTSELDGSLVSDMRYYAEQNGYSSYTSSSNLGELESILDNQKPAILLVDRGRWKVSIPHYYVVYGYNPNKKIFIINDGIEEARRINYSELESEWKKMNHIMLIMSK
jgi:ABC-type bacteriocin/lantibiotic exporter with double-glycine peptidase domain